MKSLDNNTDDLKVAMKDYIPKNNFKKCTSKFQLYTVSSQNFSFLKNRYELITSENYHR